MFHNIFNKRKPIISEAFGEVSYFMYGWLSDERYKITLWNKTYDVMVLASAKDKKDFINQNQEAAYEKFKKIMPEKQKEIEEILENYYHTEDIEILTTKFTPSELTFGKNGECALSGLNADDGDDYDDVPGLAVWFFPELRLDTDEDYRSI